MTDKENFNPIIVRLKLKSYTSDSSSGNQFQSYNSSIKTDDCIGELIDQYEFQS